MIKATLAAIMRSPRKWYVLNHYRDGEEKFNYTQAVRISIGRTGLTNLLMTVELISFQKRQRHTESPNLPDCVF